MTPTSGAVPVALPTHALVPDAVPKLTGVGLDVDPRTGEVLAMVSKPGFNPNLFVEGIDTKTYSALNTNRDRPLFKKYVPLIKRAAEAAV